MNRAPWLETLFRPLVVGVMVGCVALSVAALVRLFSPTWSATYFFLSCVLAALEAHYSYRLIQSGSVDYVDVWKFRATELALFFLLLKIGSTIGERWVDVWADIRTWPREPLNIIDAETMVAFVLVLLSWHASTQTARALERLDEPGELDRHALLPMQSLVTLFFWGGGVLLIVSGLTRVGLAYLLNLRRPSVPGLVLNVLVYFVLGVVMLGQVRFVSLRKEWRAQKIDIARELASRWVRYSLLFIGLAALLAFLLPTGYTVGLFDALSGVLKWIVVISEFVTAVIFFLFSLVAWLLAQLFRSTTGPRPQLDPGTFQPPQAGTGSTFGWLEVLRTLFFWAVALGVAFYVLYGYLRDHPEIWQALRRFSPISALYRLWMALRRWLGRWPQAIRERLPQRSPRRRAARPSSAPARFLWPIALSPRERVLYYYLSVLRRARRKGFPRGAPQTPFEYSEVLKPNLPQGQQEMDGLTQSFVEARYSAHGVEPDRARRVRVFWQRVKAALRMLDRKRSEG